MDADKRIFWHNFKKHHRVAFREMRNALRKHGFELELVFDDTEKCTDAFIVRDLPSSPSVKSV